MPKTNFISYECSAKIENKNVKLIVFGSVIDDLREEISKLADGVKVQYIGWINSEESYKYFGASDLVVFPGRHSVFWEEVAGLGIPMIVKYWSGTTHIDLGETVNSYIKDTTEEIKEKIEEVVNNDEVYENMKNVARNEGISQFSYLNIAKKSIDYKVDRKRF